MATAKTENKTAERVEIFIPRTGRKDEQDVYVSVNGTNYLIPRGQKCDVPKPVYEEYMRGERAKEKLAETIASRLGKE